LLILPSKFASSFAFAKQPNTGSPELTHDISPLKLNRSQRKESLLQQQQDFEGKSAARKITQTSLVRMATIHDNRAKMKRFPLKHLTLDATEEKNYGHVAEKIYDLLNFY